MYDYIFLSWRINSIKRRGVYKFLASNMRSLFQGRCLFQNRISKITNTNYAFYVKKKSSNFAFFNKTES